MGTEACRVVSCSVSLLQSPARCIFTWPKVSLVRWPLLLFLLILSSIGRAGTHHVCMLVTSRMSPRVEGSMRFSWLVTVSLSSSASMRAALLSRSTSKCARTTGSHLSAYHLQCGFEFSCSMLASFRFSDGSFPVACFVCSFHGSRDMLDRLSRCGSYGRK